MKQPDLISGRTKPCPECHGIGEVTRNHPGCGDYKMTCDQCYGWGYVEQSNNCTKHQWKHIATVGRCCNDYQCEICGEKRTIDSSD